jgi:hypothetical protein
VDSGAPVDNAWKVSTGGGVVVRVAHRRLDVRQESLGEEEAMKMTS